MSVLPFVLLLCFKVYADAAESDNNPITCDSNFWSTQLKEIENALDESVKPCDDFYEYACGNWRVPYRLRTLNAHDTLTKLKAENKHQLVQYFEQVDLFGNTSALDSHKLSVVKFYNSCLDNRMNTDDNGDSLRIYTDALKQISDWPILNPHFEESDANETFNWVYVSAEMQRFGVDSFWRLMVQPNWQASEQKIFYITPPKFEFLKSPSYKADSVDDDSIFLYQRYIKYLMLDLGVRVRKAKQIAEEVVQFESELMSLVSDGASVILKEPQTLHDLAAELTYNINMHKYFDVLLNEFSLPSNYSKQIIIVADKEYLQRLGKFLSKSKSEIIGKYLLVQFLAYFEVHMHEADTTKEHKENCLQQTNTFLTNELSQLFLELHHENSAVFLRSTQTQLNQIFDRLKVQFERMLNATNIFERDAVTKILGLEKLRAMRLLLPRLYDSVTVDSVPEFELVGNNYDANLLKLSKLQMNKKLMEIIKSDGAYSSSTSSSNLKIAYGPLHVNAYYSLKKNAIEIPVGILRPPLYDACLQVPKIYGSFVYILAHELLHGFDYDGLNYDKSGNVASNWGPKAIIKFGTKSRCYLSDRYKNAPLTINENIADSEGLRLAFETFLENEEEDSDGLKLFFISFAQTWCGSNVLNENTLHAGHKERVNNVLGNFPEFSEIYKCKADSTMNPEEKCKIW